MKAKGLLLYQFRLIKNNSPGFIKNIIQKQKAKSLYQILINNIYIFYYFIFW
jgi:hypothetical protein